MTDARLVEIRVEIAENARFAGPAEDPSLEIELLAEVDRLRAALKKYGDHVNALCNAEVNRCICGYDAAMET